MSWRIKDINIENFKFFHDLFSLEVDSKNLLIYGENGSGKSSIYWALYTLFQSRLKSDDVSVKKYFDPTKDENLRNKYSNAVDSSKVEITFENKDSTDADKQYVISYANVNTQHPGDTFLDLTIAASDFLNYKMLSKLTDKDNSVINDVTDLFVKEIYPFADFQRGFEDLDGNRSDVRNALYWHQYIKKAVTEIEHQNGKRHSHFDKTGVKYGRYKKLIRDFRNQLALYLDDLSIRSTAKLKEKFGIKDVEIRFETDASYDFDLPIPTSPRNRDHKLHPLHIRLNAKLVNEKLPGGSSDIVHLRTFFNEAKLTCIGLAVRLSVADMKFIPGGNLASVLCFDDMLVSLDMSYRVPVTKALLSYANDYQLCVFTHDRSLYNMMRDTIKELGYSDSNWKYLEFYHAAPATEGREEPKPNWKEVKTIKDKVQNYISQGDYPAAGNCLRKYAEDLIKGILPQNLTYGCKGGEISSLMLSALYDKTKAGGDDNFCALYDISSMIMPNIKKHLKRLMNPLSHDDKDVPIYRRELEDALAEVEKYEPIRAAKTIIVKREEAGIKRFRMEMINGADTKIVEFVTTEQWDYIVFPAPIGKKYKNCEVLIKSSSDGTYTVDSKIRIKKLYDNMKSSLFHGVGDAPEFDQVIRENATGVMLNAL